MPLLKTMMDKEMASRRHCPTRARLERTLNEEEETQYLNLNLENDSIKSLMPGGNKKVTHT